MAIGGTLPQWMLLGVQELVVGVPTHAVQRLVPLGAVHRLHRLPRLPSMVRGLVDDSGTLVPAVDLRRLLGRVGLDVEVTTLLDSLEARRADHVRWLRELEACVREDRAFSLQTDPHLCAFGRWYDAYVAPDALLRVKLLGFDAPHKLIHGIAARALAMARGGERERALALIDHVRDAELAVMLRLFDETMPLVAGSLREVLAICATGGRPFGLIADDACGVDVVDPSQTLAGAEGLFDAAAWLAGVVRVGGRTTALLDPDRLVAELAPAAASPASVTPCSSALGAA